MSRPRAVEDLLVLVLLGEHFPELLVVPVAPGQGLLEDRRVGRDPDDGVLVDHSLQLAGLEPLARERVDPDALTVFGELMKS